MQIHQLIQRADGSERRITAHGDDHSMGVYVLWRESAQHEWKLADNKPHPDWRQMSVDEYVKRGRPEMLQLVTSAEILKVTSAFHAS